MRKRLVFLLTLCAALLCMALAEETTQLTVLPVTETVRPGKGVTLAYEAPEAGEACIQLVDDTGNTVLMIDPDRASTAGTNELIWNGTYEGVPAPEGTFHLTVRLGEETSSVPIHIGPYAPYMNHLRLENGDVTPETPLRVSFTASQRGALNWSVCDSAMKIAYPLDGIAVEAGPCELTWDGTLSDGSTLPDGAYIFTLLLIDETGFESNEERLPVTVAGFAQSPPMEMPAPTATPAPTDTPQPTATDTPTPMDTPQPAAVRSFTPSYRSTDTSDTSLNYWTLPMDITDEAAVWEVLMQPITVVGGHQQAFIYVRSEPSDDAEAVGEITCASQGVHVLETLDNGWSRIEAYSSSFADSKVKAYAKFISGYVPTKKLKQITPSQEYGLVVDKLTQRLYLFKEGKLYSTMLCSTGLVNKDQPWNETMSGEYLIVSASGGFMSGNMHCAMGMRFNDGDKMHEVPYILNRDGSKNYGYTEPDLGKRASHGCLRVQRKRTPEGVNMAWLWNNRAKNVKLLIWEDWPGRQIPIPADDFQLYYNPNGGVSYHSQATCYSIKNSKNVTMQAFTYGELEQEPYASLKRCEYCAPALRRAEYEEINAQYRALEASGAETSFELTN